MPMIGGCADSLHSGAMASCLHVIKQTEADPGEAITFGSFRVLQVL